MDQVGNEQPVGAATNHFGTQQYTYLELGNHNVELSVGNCIQKNSNNTVSSMCDGTTNQ